MYNKKISISLVASFLLATNSFSNELYISSATKSEQSIKDVTSNVEVITKEDIEERNFTTVVEALNTLPGISFTSNGGLGKASSIFMRGFDSQRILVLIDGIRYNDMTGIGGAQFEHLMINDVEQIEVIKGAQSGIWGADANAGVINIITKKKTLGTHGNVNVEYGTFNTKKVSGNIAHKNDKYDISLGFSKIEADGFTTVAPYGKDIKNYEDDSYKNRSINSRVGLNIDSNNRIELSHNRIHTKSQYDGGFGSIEDKANTTEYELETNSHYSAIQYINQNKFSNIKAYGNYSRIDRDDPEGYTTRFDGDLKEFGINSEISYLSDSFLLAGLDYKITEDRNNDKTLNNKGIFLTNSNSLNNLVFTQSIRHDKYDLYKNKTTGKLGLKYTLLDGLEISSNIGTSYSVPSFYKLFDSFAGYEDLEPESTKSFDLSLDYNDLKLTYFKSKIDNMIDYNSNTYKYYNIDGTIDLDGLEVAYKKLLLSDILLNLNYTYTRAKDNNDKDLQRRAEQSFNFGLDYYGIKNLHINLNGQYIGNRIQYDFGTYDINAQTGNYTVWNSVVNYDINKNLKTYLKVDNLFNKYYQTVDGYATSPRAFYAGLKATF
jgi:vitamin B12 transporter